MQTEQTAQLSVVIPCFNEARTLRPCVERVLAIADERLSLELIIVDDGSQDESCTVAQELARQHPQVRVLRHERNQGKGAALRTGFGAATGEFVAVQDADLEYDPQDLKRLLGPLLAQEADVVLGSRFLSPGAHRVLYFWHAVANGLLTLLSNMFTDLNLTDMETGYKVFRREVLRRIQIRENRFGVEPELVAKVAQLRLRVYEMGITYRGRTYEEGKKIGFRDAVRAFYCIVRYNAPQAPVPIQFLVYVLIGAAAAVVNLVLFLTLFWAGWNVVLAAPAAFLIAAVVNYVLCTLILFRHRARWSSLGEILVFLLVVSAVGLLDLWITKTLIELGAVAVHAKLTATVAGLLLNFLGRRFLVFPEPPRGPWKPQKSSS